MPNRIPDPRAGRPGGSRLPGAVSINRHFFRHDVEMVLVMFAGMAALGLPVGLALGALDSSWAELRNDARALTLLLGEHVLMLASMFAVMLRRPREYSGHHHATHHRAATA